ncbi:hypothetical protein BURCENBC7_AP3682 [Burkholderia cenocepacia BC7]|nr:hypothetical protein BURCENK562V_C2622 [Burkholderia cenocepacia K56-2Valvano]ERI27857.1 hypothetical protein BURCENBC7_AP3682 [Burkholderia cenocepacia BC7]
MTMKQRRTTLGAGPSVAPACNEATPTCENRPFIFFRRMRPS